MKKNRTFWIGIIIGIIIVGGIASFPIIVELIKSEPKLPETIIAIDDVMVIQDWESNERVDNSETLREGYHISNGNWSTREFYRVWIQFDLPSKLREWNKCMLRVHILDFVDDEEKGKYGFRVYINSTWDETMNINEFRDNEGEFVDWDFMDIDIVRSMEIIEYDVSKHIENIKSITISFYIQNAHLEYEDYFSDMYFEVYSKDSNVSKNYLPQLVWS
jgi:hypothetical protein